MNLRTGKLTAADFAHLEHTEALPHAVADSTAREPKSDRHAALQGFEPIARYRREPIDQDLPLTGRTLLRGAGIVALIALLSSIFPQGFAL